MNTPRTQAMEARKRAGLTIAQCAVKAGLSLGAVRRVERGENVTLDTAEKYAQAVGITLADLTVERERDDDSTDNTHTE